MDGGVGGVEEEKFAELCCLSHSTASQSAGDRTNDSIMEQRGWVPSLGGRESWGGVMVYIWSVYEYRLAVWTW